VESSLTRHKNDDVIGIDTGSCKLAQRHIGHGARRSSLSF
jgi:hypothetical protein